MNNVILIGRLVRDVELRYTQTNQAYARFTIAVDREMSKENKQEAEAKGQQTADFINVVVWGKQAENCNKFLKKGRKVAIQGSISTGSYTMQDGTKRYTTDVLARRIEFIDWAETEQNSKATKPFGQYDDYDLPMEEINDEELPF